MIVLLVLGVTEEEEEEEEKKRVISRIHNGHSYITRFFLLTGEEPLVSIPYNKLLNTEHIFLTVLF